MNKVQWRFCFCFDVFVHMQSIQKSLLDMRQLFMNDRLPFEKPELVESEAVEKILSQLSNKDVYVCVLGRYNVGKSTLINALLSAEWV